MKKERRKGTCGEYNGDKIVMSTTEEKAKRYTSKNLDPVKIRQDERDKELLKLIP